MITLPRYGIACLALLLTSACSLVNNPHSEPPQPSPQVKAAPPLQGDYAMSGDCRAQAENRLSLFNKPSTYPLSEQEKNNALIALYSECTHQQQPQTMAMAGPSDASQFAALAPAAGGNMQPRPLYTGNAGVAAAGGVVVIRGNDAGQFAALSPAAGGLPAEAYAAVPPGAAYANAFGGNAAGPSVVVVESNGAMPAQQATLRPVVATPVPPMAVASASQFPPMPQAAPQASSLRTAPVPSAPLPPVASNAPVRPHPAPTSPPVPLNGSDPQQLEDVLLKN